MLHRSRDLLVPKPHQACQCASQSSGRVRFCGGQGDRASLPDLDQIAGQAPARSCSRTWCALCCPALSGRSRPSTMRIAPHGKAASRPGIENERAKPAAGGHSQASGPIGATAFAALVPDATLFKNGRHLAAWLGLTPRQEPTGGKTRLSRISKAGDGYLRRLLVLGATSLLRSSAKTSRPPLRFGRKRCWQGGPSGW